MRFLWRLASSSEGRELPISSPGTARPSPKTKSAGQAPRSGFKVVRMARSEQGSLQNQLCGSSVAIAFKDSLRRRWNLSTNPFASGWYVVV